MIVQLKLHIQSFTAETAEETAELVLKHPCSPLGSNLFPLYPCAVLYIGTVHTVPTGMSHNIWCPTALGRQGLVAQMPGDRHHGSSGLGNLCETAGPKSTFESPACGIIFCASQRAGTAQRRMCMDTSWVVVNKDCDLDT